MLDFEEEFLDFLFEFPEGGSAVDDILTFEVKVHVETAESIKGGVVATEVRRILFVALTLVNIVVGVEMVGDELF